MPRGLRLWGALLGSHLLAGRSVRSPRSLRRQERKRQSVLELGPSLSQGWWCGRGGHRTTAGRHGVDFTAPRVVFPAWAVLNLSHHFLPQEGKPHEVLPCRAGVGPGSSGDRLSFSSVPWHGRAHHGGHQ